MTKIDINRASVETPAPTKERIDAALALADSILRLNREVEDPQGTMSDDMIRDHQEAIRAYRATAPKKLRTRAERDAELNQVSSHMAALLFGPGRGQLRWGAAPGERDNFRTHTDIDKLMRLRDRWEELRAEPVAETPEQTVGTYPDRTTDSIRELTDEIRASPSGWEPGDRVGTLLAGLLNRVRDAAAIDWGNGYNWSAPVTGAPEQADEPDSVVTANHIRELQLELDGSEKALTEARARIERLKGELLCLDRVNDDRLEAETQLTEARITIVRMGEELALLKRVEKGALDAQEQAEKKWFEARTRIAELQLGEMDLLEEIRVLAAAQTARDIAASASAARIANLEATNATLRADNERFARELLESRNRAKQAEDLCGRLRLDYERQLDAKHEKLVELSAELLEARKPCERRHLTEAEEALLNRIRNGANKWDGYFYKNCEKPFLEAFNTIRDEFRQQTTGEEARAVDRNPSSTPSSPAEPEIPEGDLVPVERCSCEEAERLRNAAIAACCVWESPNYTMDEAREAMRQLREALR